MTVKFFGKILNQQRKTTFPKRERLQVGVVVMLKEMHGENRIDDFIKLCMMRGWIANQIDVNNRFDVHQKVEAELTLE